MSELCMEAPGNDSRMGRRWHNAPTDSKLTGARCPRDSSTRFDQRLVTANHGKMIIHAS